MSHALLAQKLSQYVLHFLNLISPTELYVTESQLLNLLIHTEPYISQTYSQTKPFIIIIPLSHHFSTYFYFTLSTLRLTQTLSTLSLISHSEYIYIYIYKHSIHDNNLSLSLSIGSTTDWPATSSDCGIVDLGGEGGGRLGVCHEHHCLIGGALLHLQQGTHPPIEALLWVTHL